MTLYPSVPPTDMVIWEHLKRAERGEVGGRLSQDRYEAARRYLEGRVQFTRL